jgi:uncharacterized hydrophobic protein (TIGR00271 family)
MTIALVVPAHIDLKRIVPWAAHYAKIMAEGLLVLQYQQSTSLPTNSSQQANDTQVLTSEEQVLSLIHDADILCQISESTAASFEPHEAMPVSVKSIRHPEPVDAILLELDQAKTSLVIIPRYASTKLRSNEFEIERQLFQRASSAAMQIRVPLPEKSQFKRLLVTTGSEQSSRFALNQAVKIAQATQGEVDAVFIQPDVGPLAEQVGQERVETILSRTLDPTVDCVNKRVLVTKNITQGFKSIRSMDHDLIIVGAEFHSVIERKMFSNVAEQIISEADGPPVAIVRPAMPFPDLMRKRVERFLQRFIPQLDRSQRVELVERIQLSSEWDIDFIALIVLSTLIAALGLIQNSTAVVIGAMLVAPLMTPLLGSGLSLIQGNKLLARKAAKTVVLGFITAYFLGVFLGLVIPGFEASEEMIARGSPRLPDIIIAFLSGMAAVYAMGRPHLVSALPGVAIAASLVPPIATSGLATALGEFALAQGSALLFFTNIVAIILGGSACWWIIGFRDVHEFGGFGTWAPRVASALLAIAIALGIYESWPTENLERQLTAAIEKTLPEDSAAMLMNVELVDFHHAEILRVTMGTSTSPTDELNLLIETAIRKSTTESYPIQIDWHIVWNSDRKY